ncbi:MAG: hypothetical protein H7Y37_00615 [Anaerolineae bacterium]|nr:hypothetical protein [Gloeobacterales cyanobacterium ES-bin-313]
MRTRGPLCAVPIAMLCLFPAYAGQVPGPAAALDIPLSTQDRVYTADQTSNTVSVYNPQSQELLGLIRLGGSSAPQNLSPLYRGQLLVHGLGFSPDHRTLAVVSIGSNSVSFIDTQTNRVKHVTYLGRAPHEAFYTPAGGEVWVSVRGENYVAVLDASTYQEKRRIPVDNGPGMIIFRPDGRYAFVCSSFTPRTAAIDVRTSRVVATVEQASPFCPNIAATPDGRQIWLTLKDVGKTQVHSAEPPFTRLALLDTGPLTNHVNFVRTARGQFAYITIGGENAVKVFTTTDRPQLVATIPVGELPHGLWPSADGTRLYVGLENANSVAVIDTLTNRVLTTMPGGQSPQALVYVPGAAANANGQANLVPLNELGAVVRLAMGSSAGTLKLETTVAVHNQGLIDLLQAAVTSLKPNTDYQLALAEQPRAPYGFLQPLAAFKTNPAGAAVVTALSPLKAVLQGDTPLPQRYLVIVPVQAGVLGVPVQVQLPAGQR